jgi:S-adenosylmethionine:tRNA ribosyltransferase-isomerase
VKLSEFDYQLPKKLIAAEPCLERDRARLLVLNQANDHLTDDYFYNLDKYLKSGDVLVLNDSRVIPARLEGESAGKRFEVLLVKNIGNSKWECWVRPGRKAQIKAEFVFSSRLKGKLVERKDDLFIFDFNLSGDTFYREIEKIGQVPLPPYILKARKEHHLALIQQKDLKNYQTIFAQKIGSVAAPTAGLHFNKRLLARLNKNGIQTEKVTLHVSLGTFQPVNTEKIEDFHIHGEYFEISKEAAERLNKAKKEGRRIIAVGTTSVRVLETAARYCRHCEERSDEAISKENKSSRPYRSRDDNNFIDAMSGETDIYIYPGYKFKFIDGLITNFHLPKSSLLLLVSAFAGKENILRAYRHAIHEKYRFYSYGDGMLII